LSQDAINNVIHHQSLRSVSSTTYTAATAAVYVVDSQQQELQAQHLFAQPQHSLGESEDKEEEEGRKEGIRRRNRCEREMFMEHYHNEEVRSIDIHECIRY